MTKLIVLSCLALILTAASATSGHAWQAVQEPGLQAFNQSLRAGPRSNFAAGTHRRPANAMASTRRR
jgi:hypothetical protein